ncbi:hypothetical protein SFC34_26605 [Priestia aryabhattai]
MKVTVIPASLYGCRYSYITPKSVATKDISPNAIVAGNPTNKVD